MQRQELVLQCLFKQESKDKEYEFCRAPVKRRWCKVSGAEVVGDRKWWCDVIANMDDQQRAGGADGDSECGWQLCHESRKQCD